MRRNPADLSQHYASLSNDALREINADELTGDALVLYQSELHTRHLTKQVSTLTGYVGQPFWAASRASARLMPSDGKRQHRVETRCAGPKPCPTSEASDQTPSQPNVDAEPEWMANAVAACSYVVRAGETAVADVGEMRQFVEAAGIPCLARLRHNDEDPNNPVEFCELMVPAGLHLHAVSVLDVKIFNPEMEEEWRTHFGFVSDADLVAMDPKDLAAGLLDRAQRLERVYAQERKRRGI
jgi:hypothetical protein